MIGRDQLRDEFEEAFDGIPDSTGLTILPSGQRGTGKTVLLESYRRVAEDSGRLIITESSSGGLLEGLTRDHLPRLRQAHSDQPPIQLQSASGAVGTEGGGASCKERYPAESTLRFQITEHY
ncbi:ATP-binding protein [Brachybacterium sp. UNK5269]|uniref:ATP-binding protein n=1 Tax=Brachybacterium sp. UNK5269 TaxID=3408576 RepID=UPI003BB11EA0